MRKIIAIIILLLFSWPMRAQDLSAIKHLEALSEIQDTMILLNKGDIDAINKIFFEKRQADTLNAYNEQIIVMLQEQKDALNEVIANKDAVIDNQTKIVNEIEETKNAQLADTEKLLRKTQHKVGF